MARQIMQFRYYGDGVNKDKNQPLDISLEKIQDGSIFLPYLPFTQLGIQTWPGTHFYLNDATTPIIIGQTGIYELDLEGIAEITNIRFDKDSLALIQQIDNAYLIIDAICDVE